MNNCSHDSHEQLAGLGRRGGDRVMRVLAAMERGLPRAAQQLPGCEPHLLCFFGPFVLDRAAHRLTREGRPVAIPEKAWQILLMLIEAGGCLVTHEAFRARLWPDVFVEDRTLTVHMSTLRKALAGGEGSSDVIETVFRAGYRLAVPVRVIRAARETSFAGWPGELSRRSSAGHLRDTSSQEA